MEDKTIREKRARQAADKLNKELGETMMAHGQHNSVNFYVEYKGDNYQIVARSNSSIAEEKPSSLLTKRYGVDFFVTDESIGFNHSKSSIAEEMIPYILNEKPLLELEILRNKKIQEAEIENEERRIRKQKEFLLKQKNTSDSISALTIDNLPLDEKLETRLALIYGNEAAIGIKGNGKWTLGFSETGYKQFANSSEIPAIEIVAAEQGKQAFTRMMYIAPKDVPAFLKELDKKIDCPLIETNIMKLLGDKRAQTGNKYSDIYRKLDKNDIKETLSLVAAEEQLQILQNLYQNILKNDNRLYTSTGWGITLTDTQKGHIVQLKEIYKEIADEHLENNPKVQNIVSEHTGMDSLINYHKDLLGTGTTTTCKHFKQELEKIKSKASVDEVSDKVVELSSKPLSNK